MSYLKSRKTQIVGADIFIVQKEIPKLPASIGRLQLKLISNRGCKVGPGPCPNIELIDLFRCRFALETVNAESEVKAGEITDAILQLEKSGFEWVHIEKLLVIEGKPGYSKVDGEC